MWRNANYTFLKIKTASQNLGCSGASDRLAFEKKSTKQEGHRGQAQIARPSKIKIKNNKILKSSIKYIKCEFWMRKPAWVCLGSFLKLLPDRLQNMTPVYEQKRREVSYAPSNSREIFSQEQ